MLHFKNGRNKKCKAKMLKNSGASLHPPFILASSGNVKHSWNGVIMNLGHFKVALHNVKKPLHIRGVVFGYCLQTLFFCTEQYGIEECSRERNTAQKLLWQWVCSVLLHLAGRVQRVPSPHPTVFELDIILDSAQSHLKISTGWDVHKPLAGVCKLKLLFVKTHQWVWKPSLV